MSMNAFMQPVLPQTPAPGSNAVTGKNPAAFKSNRLADRSDQGKSFSATLNRISDRNRRCNQDSAPAEKPALRSRSRDTEMSKSQKTCNRKAFAADHNEESSVQRSPESGNKSRCVHPWLALGWLTSHLTNGSGAGDGALAVEKPSDSNSGLKGLLTEWIAHLQMQGQEAHGGRVGIGPFEQLQANISPEELNRFFFKGFAAGIIHHQDSGIMIGKLIQDGALIGQPEPSGANANALLHMLKMSGAGWGLNPDTGGSSGPKMAVGLEGAHLNEDLLLKMASASQAAEAGRSENAKMGLAGQEGRLPFWASGDSNSEALLETNARQLSQNSEMIKNPAALKAAAEQPVNADSTLNGVTAKTPEEIFGIKNAAPKSEILTIQALGDKINPIDGDSKDSTLLFSQDQMPQDLARLENAAQKSEAVRSGLMSQTLNQIVQKAVLSFNNGQHEIQIHLKPDFLGHIRMQIVTESQQVTVRIAAELPFVKEMLENNLNQLKAELQAQGLKVDELEVSVAHDSGADDDKHQKAAEVLRARALKGSRLSVAAAVEEQDDGHTGRGDGIAETVIDYFA
ncbi:MAG: flagellar hook-length control protein FliK [Desulfobacterales bacterium]|jgi:flagellar hook-length control protein FliK